MYLSKYILVCLLSCGFEYTGTLFIFALLLVLVHSLATAFFQTQMVSVFLFLSLTHYTWLAREGPTLYTVSYSDCLNLVMKADKI